MIKTNIKMRVTPEQSKKVQKICFENGATWRDGSQKLYSGANFMYLHGGDILYHGASNRIFENGDEQEIDADLFIRTNGTCEEELEGSEREEVSKSDVTYQNNSGERLEITKEYKNNFEEFGVEIPDNIDMYSYELKSKDKEGNIIGFVDGFATVWNKDGICKNTFAGIGSYHLTVIAKGWYEDANNIGKMLIKENSSLLLSFLRIEDKKLVALDLRNGREIVFVDKYSVRPATREEIEKLIIE